MNEEIKDSRTAGAAAGLDKGRGAPESGSASADAPGGNAGAIAMLRCLPTKELQEAYRRAKADESEKGRHSAWLISRELIRRASPPI